MAIGVASDRGSRENLGAEEQSCGRPRIISTVSPAFKGTGGRGTQGGHLVVTAGAGAGSGDALEIIV